MTVRDTTTHSVLIVTDVPFVVTELAPQLESAGWALEVAADPEAALACESSSAPSVVLLDAAAIDDASSHCRALRAHFDAPILVFDRERQAHGVVTILEAGADDYIDRLDRPSELIARLRALTRRGQRRMDLSLPVEPSGDGLVIVGDITLDPERHEVHARGRLLPLTLRQFDLLHLLLRHPNQILPRATILERVWGSTELHGSNTLEVQVMRLRRWVEVDPTSPTRIRTVRGIGHQLVDR